MFKRLLSSVQRTKSFFALFSIQKFKKTANEFYRTDRERKQRKKYKKKKSVGKALDASSLCCVLIYIFTAHLQSNVLATVERRVFLFETRRTTRRISRLFQRRRRWWWYSRKR